MIKAGSDRHFTDELLEKYSIGNLENEQLPPLEEHLLVCSECQVRLTDIDDYVQAARGATAEMERKRATRKPRVAELLLARFWPTSKPVWALGLATGVLAVAVAVVIPSQFQQGRQTELHLLASRGPDTAVPAHAAARDKIRLTIDTAMLPAAPVYQLQLVSSNGAKIWKTSVAPHNNEIVAAVPRKLSAGKYWVRIYSGTDFETPLREYGFQVD